jgi:7-cyano-7-deazaguanine synthase
MKTSRAVVLLSAGLDSTVSLALAHAEGAAVAQALTFDYGQRAAAPEIERARQIAAHYGIPLEVIDLPWLGALTTTALAAHSSAEVPEVAIESLDSIATVTLQSAKQVWVPNRNGLFVNIAAVWADSKGYDAILVGFNAEEAATFPDNTPQFAQAITHSLAYSTQNQPQVRSEVQHLNKVEIFQAALRLDVPLHLIWSCYHAGPHHCGKCESCSRLLRAARASDAYDTVAPLFSGGLDV